MPKTPEACFGENDERHMGIGGLEAKIGVSGLISLGSPKFPNTMSNLHDLLYS